MAQDNEGFLDPTRENENRLSEEGSFVSPEEAQGLLATLDEQDRRVLDSGTANEMDEDGEFLSPQDVEVSAIDEEQPMPEVPVKNTRLQQTSDPSLLSRIASELHSIKSELSHLKISYDDMLSQSNSPLAAESPALPGASPQSTLSPPPRENSTLPEISGELYPDLKKLLVYLDRLLESLPEEKIDQFARSEYFDLYRKVFEYFDLV